MPYLILIAGGSGSGKTTIAKLIAEKLSLPDVTVFSHDNYYRDHRHLSSEEKEDLNCDHPDAIDVDELLLDIKKLLKGESVKIPIYNFSRYSREDEKILVPASDIIILEGIFAIYYIDIVEMADLRIFVDTAADVRLIRRINRDITERGYSLQSVLDRYLATVRPMHEAYVEPTKERADIIIRGDGPLELDEIMRKLHNITGK